MIRSTKRSTRGFLLSLATAHGIMLSGCGGDDAERRYPASGTVTYKGEPVASGEITFTPADPNKGLAASAAIQGGSFTLTTITERDGAVPGQYKVAITARDVDSAKLKDASGRLSNNPKVIAKANRDAKNLIPQKYESSQSSPLTAEVKAQSNSFTFDLLD